MPNTIELRDGMGGLLAPEFVPGVIEAATHNSVVLSRFRRLRDMTQAQTVMSVRSELPQAGAVDAIDEPAPTKLPARKHMKPVTTQRFDPLNIYAGEFAAIKVFRDADLSDALNNGYDIVSGDIPLIGAQFGAAIDRAVFWGIKKPYEWSTIDSLWKRANDTGNVVNSTGNPYLDLFGEESVAAKIVASGYPANGIVANPMMQFTLNALKDDVGRPLFVDTIREGIPARLNGLTFDLPMNGMWDATKAKAMVADMNSLVYSIREDLTYRIDRSATIVDNNGYEHRLAQQNKTAIIFHMRLGWQVLDPVTQMSESPVPFAFYLNEVTDG